MNTVHVELEGGDCLQEPRIGEWTGVDGAERRDRADEFDGDRFGFGIVAREEDVARHRTLEPQQVGGGGVLERGDDPRPRSAALNVDRRGAFGDRSDFDAVAREAQRVHDVDEDLAVEAVPALAQKGVEHLEGQRQEDDVGARCGGHIGQPRDARRRVAVLLEAAAQLRSGVASAVLRPRA